MRIGILHGWLLTGSGSNIYVQNVAKSLWELGHEVHVFCQDREAENLPFVSKVIFHNPDGDADEARTESDGVIVHIPNIGEVLPVFVWDNYPAFKTVIEFPKLSFGELQNYLLSNVKAVTKGVQEYNIDVLHANHAIMMPSIARDVSERTGIPYLVALHGSALIYAVKEDPTLFDYAVRGLEGARAILVGNQYFKSAVSHMFSNQCSSLSTKLLEIPLGVDTGTFKPVMRDKRSEAIEMLLDKAEDQFNGRTAEQTLKSRLATYNWIGMGEIPEAVFEFAGEYPQKYPDADLPERIKKINWSIPTIIFVGRLIFGKGVQDLLIAYHELIKRIQCQLILVGNGPIREWLEAYALFRKHGINLMLEPWLRVAQNMPESENLLEATQNWVTENALTCKPTPEATVLFTGFLDHSLLQYILPCADIAVFPSLVPESFGLVVLEAASAGVIPVVTDFSGLRDSAIAFEKSIPELIENDLRFPLESEKRIQTIVSQIEHLFNFSDNTSLRESLRITCEREYSWNSVTRALIQVYESIIS